MTLSDFVFLYCFACAVWWAACAMRKWEGRDLDRIRLAAMEDEIINRMRAIIKIQLKAMIGDWEQEIIHGTPIGNKPANGIFNYYGP